MRSWGDFVHQGSIPENLTHEKPIIALYGGYQVGKSTLINCLSERYVSLAGKGLATTSLTSRYRYGNRDTLRYQSVLGGLRDTSLAEIRNRDFIRNIDIRCGFSLEAETPAEILRLCDIVDTPGYDASGEDNAVALKALEHVHYILFVIPNREMKQKEKELLLMITRREIPVSILMNCSVGRRQEKWIPEHEWNKTIAASCESWLTSMDISPIPIEGNAVYLCNFLFFWSQMEDFQRSAKDIVQPDTVHRHIAATLTEEGYRNSSEEIIRLSGVRELSNNLTNLISRYDPISHQISPAEKCQ